MDNLLFKGDDFAAATIAAGARKKVALGRIKDEYNPFLISFQSYFLRKYLCKKKYLSLLLRGCSIQLPQGRVSSYEDDDQHNISPSQCNLS